jgi:hypothetical protein
MNARAAREASAIHRRTQWFRLIWVPLATPSRVMTQDQTAGHAHESARSSYFRRKWGRLSALQRVYGQQHNHYNIILNSYNWITNAELSRLVDIHTSH